MWNTAFILVNCIALCCWILLIAVPRRPLPLAIVLYGGVAMLCLAYSIFMLTLGVGMASGEGGLPRMGVDIFTIAGIRTLFSVDSGAVLGWTHYLAFDLFVGLWIARDADAKGFSRLVQVPVLLMTCLAGPVGLLVWLVVRERRARKLGRPT
ncbi:MAG: ABA4-like family protein [Sphingomonadaceae bacterium]